LRKEIFTVLIRSFGLRAKLGLTLASLTLLPLATAPAHAQGKPSGGPTLSAAQKKKAQSLATQYQKAMQSLGNDKSLSQTQKQAKFQSLAKSYQSEMMALLTPAQRERVKKALLDIDPKTPEGKEILDLNRASRYIATVPENYRAIEAAARSSGLLK